MERLLAPLVTAAGLLGGFGAARATGRRSAGGVVLAIAATAAFLVVRRRGGPVRAGIATALTLAAFGGSHPLSRRLGAWPSVATVAAAAAVPAALLAAPRRD